MDHGVISSWSHHGRYIQFCDFTMISVNTVPGIVSFTIQYN